MLTCVLWSERTRREVGGGNRESEIVTITSVSRGVELGNILFPTIIMQEPDMDRCKMGPVLDAKLPLGGGASIPNSLIAVQER
jgi:hypothetical protein